MVNISDFTKQQGTFLKAEHVNASKTKVFVPKEEAQIVHNEKYDTDRLHILGEMDENEYTFDCSRTNSRVIADALGEDTKAWLGKSITLEIYKTKTSEGKMVDAINVSKAE